MSEEIEDDLNEVELATQQVPSYQRRTESGQVITVRGYVRTDNSAVADRARQSPGRPSVAAASGRFPGDRAIPVWPDAGKGRQETEPEEEAVEYEGIEETGTVDQVGLDKEVPIALEIMKNLPQNPALKKLMSLLASTTTATLSDVDDPPFDPNVIELARGVVRVSGYSYINKKTGKVVRVDPYSQMRKLIGFLGGHRMAAKKGITPDLVDKAMPGFDMKNRVFKQKKPTGGRLNSPSRKAGKRSTADVLREVNQMPIDREFDVPAPKPGEDYMAKAMSTQNPLEAVRNAREGSKVVMGNESWARGMDGKWYKTPRRNGNGLTDRALTKAIASKGGRVELSQGNPVQRKSFPLSKPDYDALNPNSTNYSQAVRYTKALEPTFANLPEGVADSLNGQLDVRRTPSAADRRTTGMTKVTATKANNHYPKLTVHPNPEYEKDLINTLPKQQREGYTVPTTLHPVETVMARESSNFVETLMQNRAPADMVDRMYDRLSAAYDKHATKDDGDFTGLTGRDGWVARMTGERSDELKEQLRDSLSMSGLNSPEDFLAEAWTEYVGNPEPRPLAKDLGEAYQTGMEEFSDYLFKNKWVDASEIPEATYNRTTKKTASRKVSDAIDGAEDRTVETNTAPRSLRSVLQQSSKYIDVRDEDGNPTFDAEVSREGDTATLGTLTYPRTNVADMPTSIPRVDVVNTQENARYYSTPIEDLSQGVRNQMRYAQFIDNERALKAIEAVEETMYSEGVRRFEVEARPGEDSILYARAGYQFNPDVTDAYEISNMLGDAQDLIDSLKEDADLGFYPLPKSEQRKIKTALTKMERRMTSDPATWPTPQDIAKLGKMRMDENSLGEDILDRYAWSGVKELPEGSFQSWTPAILADDEEVGYGFDFKFATPENLAGKMRVPQVSATAINDVARAVSQRINEEAEAAKDAKRAAAKSDSQFRGSMKTFADSVLERHQDTLPGATSKVTGKPGKYTMSVNDADGNRVFSLTSTTNEDGSVTLSPTTSKTNLASAFVGFDMLDHLESAYQQSDVKTLRRRTGKDDPIGAYVMASTGYTWSKPPSKEELQESLTREVDIQMATARNAMEQSLASRSLNATTEEMFRSQSRLERELEDMRESLMGQVNSYLEKFNTDEEGPTPFEIAQIGKREAYKVARVRANTPRRNRTSREPIPAPPPLHENATAAERAAYDLEVDRIARANERAMRQQGTLMQQMTSIDGDPIHDSFIEFVGKQTLTLGAYEWYKTLGGYWNWATDAYNPSARKASVGLLFILLRLLPASVFRGGLLQLANTMTRRIRSPRAEDWPSPQEIEALIDQLETKIPDSEIAAALKEMDNG